MQNFTLIPQQGAGRGRLVRMGNTIVYSAGDAAAASTLVGWCRLVGDRPTSEVMGELARLASGGAALGPFCAILIGDASVDVLVQGGVPLMVQRSSGAEPIGASGLGAFQTQLRDISALDLLFGDSSVDPLLTINDGVIAADGFSLRAKTVTALPWGPAPGAASQPVAAPAAPAGAVPAAKAMVSLREPGNDDLPPAEPLPILVAAPAAAAAAPAPSPAQPAPAPAPAPALAPALADTAAMPAAAAPHRASAPAASSASGPQPVKVKGLVCSRGHFNDPRTRFCATCGIAMHQTSFILSDDVRPPLGVLVMSDGAYHTLVTSLVFGRDPDDDPEVREGRAQGVTLIDPGNTISRVHAEIRAVEWDVHIVDHGSTNGSFVWSNDRQQWDRLTPNQPVLLSPGSHVAFGRLTATFESSARQKG